MVGEANISGTPGILFTVLDTTSWSERADVGVLLFDTTFLATYGSACTIVSGDYSNKFDGEFMQ